MSEEFENLDTKTLLDLVQRSRHEISEAAKNVLLRRFEELDKSVENQNWIVELVTNEIICNPIEIEAENIVKVDYQALLVDGVEWKLPTGIGISFAEITPPDNDQKIDSR
jgi:hypothetical protein